ncbi:hypothetical protein [Acuticoccus mangrovi]|uniref:Uncharacterized protein n=1 Tax=Acuticoccus mangrovi TaxID=2796142 RepID=A0A934ITQ6_9HYPH|nr:hypothetical protein [Acuticoccus mangrovi]MBJ3778433.1 hypothetical protein [Acuticoccus mangrovi]
MLFDPLKIQDYHDRVRDCIEAGKPGFAQGYLFDVLVSYETASPGGPFLFPVGFCIPIRPTGVLEELILDVARGEATASPYTFRRSRIERMIDERRTHPMPIRKLRRQADMLTAFYMAPDSTGHRMIF